VAPFARIHLPAADPATTLHCTLYHRDAAFAALAEAELQALGDGYAPEPGVWLSSTPIRWASCGYGKGGGRQLAYAPTLEALEKAIRELEIVAPRFRIKALRIPRRRKGATVARIRVGDCIDGDVSEDDPMLRLLLAITPLGYRVLLETDHRPAEAAWLGAAHKPHNSMVGLPVRIAKAILNLTVQPGDTVFDPFCGTGTIPLLAAWAGHQAFGSDKSAACVLQAEENFAHFGRQAMLTCADARTVHQTADCIVSNLPYGVYCHLAVESLQAILCNLARSSSRVTLVTSTRIEDDLRRVGYDVVRVIPVESERFQRFVYVARSPAGA
jgi:predicted RNA methylase